jgi:hypothetical protein
LDASGVDRLTGIVAALRQAGVNLLVIPMIWTSVSSMSNGPGDDEGASWRTGR